MTRRAVWVSSLLLLVAAGAAARALGDQVRDVDGHLQSLFKPSGRANVLVFVSSDCPISNGYAPEIQRICDGVRNRGAACTLVYEDMSIDVAGVRAHQDLYRYQNMPAVIDLKRELAARATATVTPEAIVVGQNGAVKYRGRIDDQYAALGKPRRVVTQHDLSDAIDAVLNGRPVAHPATEAFGCFIPPRKGFRP